MSQQAEVRSIQALREFRAALIQYQNALRDSAESLLMEGRRGIEWVQSDRPSYWPGRVRRLDDALLEAKQALEQCEARGFGENRSSSCIDEKKAVARLKSNLDTARQKVQVSRSWRGKVQKDSDEFETRIVQLNDYADLELPKAIAALERIIEALEQYVATGTTPARGVAVPGNKLAALEQAKETARKQGIVPGGATRPSADAASDPPHSEGDDAS